MFNVSIKSNMQNQHGRFGSPCFSPNFHGELVRNSGVDTQEELQSQHAARVGEERRQRARELDDLARRAVAQMVPGRQAAVHGRSKKENG